MKKEIGKAVEIAKAAKGSADERGESWADEVDRQLMQAGIEVLSAVAYGAETDTSLIAVVEIDDVPVGIWCRDDGSWSAESITEPSASELKERGFTKKQAAVMLGRLGGQAKSKAKTDAARENAKKGGRPPKIKIFGGDADYQRATEYAQKRKGKATAVLFEHLNDQTAEMVRDKFGLDAWNCKDGIEYTYVVLE